MSAQSRFAKRDDPVSGMHRSVKIGVRLAVGVSDRGPARADGVARR
jgi:hypothetical protein